MAGCSDADVRVSTTCEHFDLHVIHGQPDVRLPNRAETGHVPTVVAATLADGDANEQRGVELSGCRLCVVLLVILSPVNATPRTWHVKH